MIEILKWMNVESSSAVEKFLKVFEGILLILLFLVFNIAKNESFSTIFIMTFKIYGNNSCLCLNLKVGS